MMRRYVVLAIVTLALGTVLALAGRRPRQAATSTPQPVARPAVALALSIVDAGIEPAWSDVESGTRVRLTIENRRDRPVSVSLAGYEDRLGIGALAPGGRWSGQFVADRPGEAFAWVVDGVPAGRLAVTGSHLVEGHR